jgi:hypothetical protein
MLPATNIQKQNSGKVITDALPEMEFFIPSQFTAGG